LESKEIKKKKEDDMADLALVKRFNSGDEQAFFDLVTRYKNVVFGLVLRFINDRHEAEDVSQEVFFQFYKALPTFKGKSRLFTWLYRIVFNVCLYYKRSKQTKGTVVSFEAVEKFMRIPDPALDPLTLSEQSRTMEKINRAVEKLPLELKTAFLLREIEELNYKEIALITGVGVGTVKSRIHNARAYLAKELTKPEGEK